MPNSFGSRYSEEKPLPAELEPLPVSDRFATVAAGSPALSLAEQREVEAELWKKDHGFTRKHLRGALSTFRSLAALEGYERYLTHKLAGEISGSPQIGRYKRDLSMVRAAIRRWRAKGQTRGVQPTEKLPQARRQQRKSPGRPRNASRRVSLPGGGIWIKKAAA